MQNPPTEYTGVYLLHFSSSLKHSTCKHYIGSSNNTATRFLAHRLGHGSRTTRAAVRQAIDFDVVQFWRTPTFEEALALEQALKRSHHHDRFCPICRARKRLGLPR